MTSGTPWGKESDENWSAMKIILYCLKTLIVKSIPYETKGKLIDDAVFNAFHKYWFSLPRTRISRLVYIDPFNYTTVLFITYY